MADATLAEVPDYPFPFKQFEQTFRTFSEPALRHLYFESKPRQSSRGAIEGNGFADAFLKVGGRVYVKPRTLFELMSRRSA
ncbi:MAG TPA: hypothetical protein VFC18_02310 [Burkholderiales bacterium]|nr:hypothetical protein [Burkholderiales bacterium]